MPRRRRSLYRIVMVRERDWYRWNGEGFDVCACILDERRMKSEIHGAVGVGEGFEACICMTISRFFPIL